MDAALAGFVPAFDPADPRALQETIFAAVRALPPNSPLARWRRLKRPRVGMVERKADFVYIIDATTGKEVWSESKKIGRTN